MKRVVLLKVGKRNIQLLRILGVLVMLGSLVLMIAVLSNLTARAQQLNLATQNTEIAQQVFGVTPSQITPELSVGYLLTPIGWILLWMGVFVIGVMVYKAGSLFLPIEEEVKDV